MLFQNHPATTTDCFRVFIDRLSFVRGFPALLSSLKLCSLPEPCKISVGCLTDFNMPAEFYCSGIVDLKPFNGARSVASTSLAFSMPAGLFHAGIVDLKPFTNGARSVASTSLAFSMPARLFHASIVMNLLSH